MVGKSQSTGSGDHRVKGDGAKLLPGLDQKIGESLLYIGIMSFIIGEDHFIPMIHECDLDSGGSDIDSQFVNLIHSWLRPLAVPPCEFK